MFEIGTLTGSDCHQQFLARVKFVAEAVGWETLRTSSSEWIGKSDGLSGTEEIFLGVMTYESVPNDYYNVLLGGFTGYSSGNPFSSQPGAQVSGVPAHNAAITYYLTVNKQRIAFCLKVGPPVYMHGYVGKIFPYSPPGNFPYPLVCAGMLTGQTATRYDNANLNFPYHGSQTQYGVNTFLRLREPNGIWNRVRCYPFSNGNTSSNSTIGSTFKLVPVELFPPYTYQLEPIILEEDVVTNFNNIWGELDGVRGVTGFGGISENIIQVGGSSVIDQTGLTKTEIVEDIHGVGGKAYVMLQNAFRNDFQDFIALEMI